MYVNCARLSLWHACLWFVLVFELRVHFLFSSKWSPINELDKLKSLQEIRFRFNPLNNSDTPENVREMFVAKLPRIEILNRTRIIKNEHLGAEYDYLKRYGIEWYEVTEGKDINGQAIPAELLEEKRKAFYRDHPRYTLLVKSKKCQSSRSCDMHVNSKSATVLITSCNRRVWRRGKV